MYPNYVTPTFNSVDNNSNSSKKKKVIIILGIFLLIGIILSVLYLPTIIASANMSLKEYSNNNYSMLVPESYSEVKEGDTVAFYDLAKPDSKTKTIDRFKMSINSNPIKEGELSEYLKVFDDDKDENIFASFAILQKNEKIKNLKIDKKGEDSDETRLVLADIEYNKKIVRNIGLLFVFKDDIFYVILINAQKEDLGLKANMNKIFDSFTIK